MDQDLEFIISNEKPPEGNKNTWLVIIGTATVIAAAIFGVKGMYFKTAVPSHSPATKNMSVEQTKQVLLVKTQLSFPEINNSFVISGENIPKELKVFVDGNLQDQIFKSGESEDRKTWYQISFSLDSAVTDTFEEYLKKGQKDWTLVSASKAISFSFIELENADYQMRITFTSLEQNRNQILIEALKR